jgi:hypothetical protein
MMASNENFLTRMPAFAKYQSARDCIRDFEKMISNCKLYNKPMDDVVVMATDLEILFKSQIVKIPEEEWVTTPPTGKVNKVVRNYLFSALLRNVN